MGNPKIWTLEDKRYVEAAFNEETLRLTGAPNEIRFKVQRLGLLNLPSGRIIACDPFVHDGIPFVDPVTPGRYPVSVSIAAAGSERRVAFARLEISNAAVRTWRQTYRDTDEIDFYGFELRLGYGVDLAMGCFMDTQALPLHFDRLEKDPGYEGAIFDEANANLVDSCQWADVCPDPNSDLNIVLFESGWGDGFYSTYLGLDQAGDIACFVTDFEVLQDRSAENWR